VQVKQEKQEVIPTASPPKSIVGKQREQKNRRQQLPNHRRTQQRRALVREVSPTGQSSRKVTLCGPKSKSKSRVYTTRTEIDSSSGDVPQIKDECTRKKCRDIVPKDGLLSGKKRPLDEKKLRRREQNRRAAVKSRKRKKVYLQELENKVKKLRETNDDLMAKMQALIAENEKLRKGVTVKASSPLPQSPAPSSLNCSPTPSSLSCDTFSKRSVSSTEENNLQDMIYSNVVKSESADGVDGNECIPALELPSSDDPSRLWKPVEDLLGSDHTASSTSATKGSWPTTESFEVADFFVE